LITLKKIEILIKKILPYLGECYLKSSKLSISTSYSSRSKNCFIYSCIWNRFLRLAIDHWSLFSRFSGLFIPTNWRVNFTIYLRKSFIISSWTHFFNFAICLYMSSITSLWASLPREGTFSSPPIRTCLFLLSFSIVVILAYNKQITIKINELWYHLTQIETIQER